MGKRGQPHPNTVKAPAIAIAETQSVAVAARTLGLAPSTIKDWLRAWHAGDIGDGELQDQVDRLLVQYRAEGETAMAGAVSKGAQLLRRDLDRYLERESEQPLKPSEMRDIAVCLGILSDKLLLLEGKPGSVSARFSYSRTESVIAPTALDLP